MRALRARYFIRLQLNRGVSWPRASRFTNDLTFVTLPDRIVGIHGFSFSRPFEAGGIEFVPLYGFPECRDRAADTDSFQVTGYGRFKSPSANAHRDSEIVHLAISAMTFLQQREVAASLLIDMSDGDSVESFVHSPSFLTSFPAANPRQSFGDVIVTDAWRPQSRGDFVRSFVERFRDERPNDALRQAFFRHIEIWRLSTPFVELHHFLAFSGLELLARSRGDFAEQRNAAVPIAIMLNELGFGCTQQEIELWTKARNRAFHEGQLITSASNGAPEIRLTDQLMPLSTVLGDVLLKLLPFDDGHINWNRWRDRQAFC